MTPSALLMVLAAAVLHAAWNLAAKAKKGDSFVFVWWYSALQILVLAAPAAWVLATTPWEPVPLLAGALVSGAFHIGYNLCLQAGYDRAPLGVVYPTARGTGPVLTMLVAVLLLGERPGWHALVGALLVVGGIVLTALPPRGETAPRARGAGRTPLAAGLLWGAATGAFIAGYTLWDDRSVAAWAVSPVPYYALTCVVETLLMSFRLTRERRAVLGRNLRENWKPAVAVAVLSPAAYLLVLVAMRTQPVSLVAPLRETSIVIGSLVAWLVFREGSPGRRLAGAGIVLAGVAIVAA